MKRRMTVIPKDASSAWADGGHRYRMNQAAVFEGDFDFEVEDLESYVQVKTGTYSRLTYRDPSGSLEAGDRVIVPLGWKNAPSLGTVIDTGRGDYDGPTKDVESRVLVQELLA